MWNMFEDMMPNMGRMLPRRNRGLNTTTAMLIGAGIGIAAWETMRRTNATGRMINGMTGGGGNQNPIGQVMDGLEGMDNNTITQMANQVMNAMQ